MAETLTQAQTEHYAEHGYLMLENRIPPDWLSRIRDEIGRFEEEARGMTASNDRLDLEDSHTPEAPRLRRIKQPHRISDVIRELMFTDHVPALPIRIPQPPPDTPLSIHEIQKALKSRAFDTIPAKETTS